MVVEELSIQLPNICKNRTIYTTVSPVQNEKKMKK